MSTNEINYRECDSGIIEGAFRNYFRIFSLCFYADDLEEVYIMMIYLL